VPAQVRPSCPPADTPLSLASDNTGDAAAPKGPKRGRTTWHRPCFSSRPAT